MPSSLRSRRAASLRRGVPAVLVAIVLLVAACADMDEPESAQSGATQPVAPPPTSIPTGSAPPDAVAALDEIASTPTSAPEAAIIERVEAARDVRLAWLLADLLRFHRGGPADQPLVQALAALTGVEVPADHQPWVFYSDLLLVWDVPAPPDYLRWKRAIYTGVDPSWVPFFDDDSELDWRMVTWAGGGRENPAPLDDPELVPAPSEDGDWLPGDEVVYGIEIAGETRAYPRRVLQAHEVVNDTVGGRRIAVTFCSLSDAVVAHYLDDRPEGVGTLRLSSTGLLDRSTRLLYDTTTESLVNPVKGAVVAGPLAGGGTLTRVPVVVTTWEAWRDGHPDTTVVSEDGGVGRVYVDEPVADPDAPPSFPVGARDERLDSTDPVLAAEGPDGTSVAFVAARARETLAGGAPVAVDGIELELDAGGLVARDALTGRALGSFETQWFAWSQVRPDTVLWGAS